MGSLPSLRERYAEAARAGRPLLGGHRGNPAEHPENTLRSFASALELGVDMIECDVHLSSDGELVVIHDHTLDRTTDGHGLVHAMTAAELRRLDAGGGERIPALSEVAELARGRAGLIIETKQVAAIRYQGLEEKLVRVLADADMLDQAAVISFFHLSAKAVKELEPRLQVGIIEYGTPVDPVAVLRQARADIYSPHFSGVDAEIVDQVHLAGGVVGVWVVNDAVAVAAVRAAAPDSVFSDRPREILRLLRDQGS